jgi:hypothetical protein
VHIQLIATKRDNEKEKTMTIENSKKEQEEFDDWFARTPE